ncbi:MAG: DUF512 domain-containing protein [Coriobacteriia bacterium]|nr:DUF512 domain-containing protein [Coriobacteriia bacterium]
MAGQAVPKAMIATVDTASPAERAGLATGDILVTAGGAPVRDVIDWRWLSDGLEVTVCVRRVASEAAASGKMPAEADVRPEAAASPPEAASEVFEAALTRAPGEGWGIAFDGIVFDRIRTCENSCTFCFVRQLPAGLRPALYLRDDDFRLSFLQGNFITLTNLDDDDLDRITEQRLSPLYVSLHAVNPDVRRGLLCAKDDRALKRFDELALAGIDLHVQIVLVPGVNDGDELTRTLTWLAEREGVASVGVVPLGYTRHQERFSASYNDPASALRVIEQVRLWQFEMRERDGVSWIHLADEFYLGARERFPIAEHYDGFPQYENGIGIVRAFVDEATGLRDELAAAVAKLPTASSPGAESVTVVTGMGAATTLAGALNACGAVGRVRLLAVPNRFFGGNVNVTGLLTGTDVSAAIAMDLKRVGGAGYGGANAGGRAAARTKAQDSYLLPDIMFNADGITLDDLSFEGLVERNSGADVHLVSSDAVGLLEGIRRATQQSNAE